MQDTSRSVMRHPLTVFRRKEVVTQSKSSAVVCGLPLHNLTVEQPAIEDEAAKNPDERHSVPAVVAPQSEILEVDLSGNPVDVGSALDEVQDSREVIPANEGGDGRQVPIEVALEDAEPPAAAKAQAVEVDNASPQETVPLAQVSADVIVLEPKSTAPAVAERGDERPRDEATVKTADDDLQQDIAQRPEEIDRALPRYRPPPQKTPQPAREKARTANEDRAAPSAPSAIELGIRLHLTFDRSGMCSIGLLPERTAGLDNEVPVNLRKRSQFLTRRSAQETDLLRFCLT